MRPIIDRESTHVISRGTPRRSRTPGLTALTLALRLFVIMAFAFVIMALSGGKRHDHAAGPTGTTVITNDNAMITTSCA
jgi:hypothetical protein